MYRQICVTVQEGRQSILADAVFRDHHHSIILPMLSLDSWISLIPQKNDLLGAAWMLRNCRHTCKQTRICRLVNLPEDILPVPYMKVGEGLLKAVLLSVPPVDIIACLVSKSANGVITNKWGAKRGENLIGIGVVDWQQQNPLNWSSSIVASECQTEQ